MSDPERLVIIHNPNSTRARRVGREVFDVLDSAEVEYTPLATKSPGAEDNIDDMREFIRDGDRIVVAAGDGTSMQAVNAVVREGHKESVLGFLPFGNFRDLASVHPLKTADLVPSVGDSPLSIETLHPLTLDVNGKYRRDIPSYFTMGWTALAASEFGNQKSREKIKSAPESIKLLSSLWQLGGNYLAHRGEFLPPFHTSRSALVQEAVSDVMAVNSPRVGRIVRFPLPFGAMDEFGFRQINVFSLQEAIPFGLKALASRADTELMKDIDIVFESPSDVPIQTEGEFEFLEDVSSLSIRKDPTRTVKVMSGRVDN